MLATILLLIGGFGATELILMLIPVLLLVVVVVPWLYAVIEILTKPFKNDVDKIAWLLVVLLLPGLGAILYFILGRSKLASR